MTSTTSTVFRTVSWEWSWETLRARASLQHLLCPLPAACFSSRLGPWTPPPGEVLSQVNETLLARIPSNMFVTCLYAILEPENGRLSYANAGHDLPYVRRGGGCEELRARGMPLGLMPGMSYEEKEIVLDAGEAALFYSDGLVEAHDPRGEMFGFPRLRALVAEHGEKGSLADLLLEELYSFVGEGWEQEDDITLLILRRSATTS